MLSLVVLMYTAAAVYAQPQEVAVSSASIASVQAAMGPARVEAAKDILPQLATINNLSESSTASFLKTQHDMDVMLNGQFVYSCFRGGFNEVTQQASPEAVMIANAFGPAGGTDPATGQAFVLHSRPSATRKLYLDFRGCDLSKC